MTPVPVSVDTTLADLVRRDERAAAVLERFGLHFCCGGDRPLAAAAAEDGAALDDVLAALRDLGEPPEDPDAPMRLTIRELTARIVERHHVYVRDQTPIILSWLERLVAHHGAAHPELIEIQRVFAGTAAGLLRHMLKEEHLLFPYVRELETARTSGRVAPANAFGTVLNPIRMMEADHAREGEALAHIRALAHDYAVPAGGCATYRACMDALAGFERDLHQHVHLENNVLFPRAIAIERELADAAERATAHRRA
jgi:regulator of cell morphogenesis and NO signaling